MATKVSLRSKAISKNRHSLYLDFYPPIPHPETGEPTRREFLGMYLMDKAKTPIDKLRNKEAKQIAEQIRQKRENSLNKSEIYSEFEKGLVKIKEQGKKDFIDYFRCQAEKRNGSSFNSWIASYKYFKLFSKGEVTFSDLNETFCAEFRDHLLKTSSSRSKKKGLSNNTAVIYFSKFKSVLKQAFRDGYLQIDIGDKVPAIKTHETQRNFLTLEELNRLVKTDCLTPVLKRAALFSALTGLRFSDIEKMTWKEVEFIEGNGYFVKFIQKKTKRIEMMPISEQAYSMLGDPQQPNAQVFDGLIYSAYYNRHLFQWIGAAGITKSITFHCFRHTFATLQLSNGTDIYTVSKMMGHRDLKSTQVYAKIVDQTKREAADKIKLDL